MSRTGADVTAAAGVEGGADGRQRSTNLDALRAGAAVYVLAGHAYLLSGSAIGFHDRNPIRLAINTGGAGVWLFFALSGYLISAPFVRSLLSGDALPKLWSYGGRRALRIYPAYWVALAAVIVLRPGLEVGARQVLVHGALLHNLVPGWQQGIYFASWTLTLEVLFYAAVPLAALAARRLRSGPISADVLSAAVVLAWLASVAFVAGVPTVASGDRQLWLRILFPSMLSMFCPGILVAIAVHAPERPRWFVWIVTHRRAALGLVLAFAVVGAVGATAVPIRLYDASRQLFALASGIGIVLALTRAPLERGGRLLAWLGMISYGIYLWQGAIIYAFERRSDLVPMRHTGYVAYLVHLALLLLLTLPPAWLSWRLIEEPCIRAGHRLRGAVPRRQRVP